MVSQSRGSSFRLAQVLALDFYRVVGAALPPSLHPFLLHLADKTTPSFARSRATIGTDGAFRDERGHKKKKAFPLIPGLGPKKYR